MAKWTFLKGACALAAATAVFVACTDAKHERKELKLESQFRVNAKDILQDPDLSKQEKAKQLVAAGEQILMPESFHLANQVFEQALAQDPENKLAEVYVELLKPVMNLKGILGRIEPIMKKDEREYPRYKQQLDNKEFYVKGYHNGRQYNNEVGSTDLFFGPFWSGSFVPVDFLADSEGLSLINNEAELQDFIKSQAIAFDNLRRFLNKNINSELEISISEKWAQQRASQRAQICRYVVISEMKWDFKCDGNPSFMKVKLDRGDMEALKAGAAGMQIYHIVSSAYDASDAQKHIKTFRGAGQIRTDRNKIETVLNGNDKTGTLNDDNMLNQILELGKDGMIGARWIRENFQSMCPGQNENMAFYIRGYDYNWETHQFDIPRKVLLRREGKLFDRGICWDEIDRKHSYQELSQLFDTIDKALVGETVELTAEQKHKVMSSDGSYREIPTGVNVSAMVKPSVAFTSPVQDLRNLRPSEYNDCGKVKSLSDKSLGGVFVNSDAEEFLKESGQLNQRDGECNAN